VPTALLGIGYGIYKSGIGQALMRALKNLGDLLNTGMDVGDFINSIGADLAGMQHDAKAAPAPEQQADSALPAHPTGAVDPKMNLSHYWPGTIWVVWDPAEGDVKYAAAGQPYTSKTATLYVNGAQWTAESGRSYYLWERGHSIQANSKSPSFSKTGIKPGCQVFDSTGDWFTTRAEQYNIMGDLTGKGQSLSTTSPTGWADPIATWSDGRLVAVVYSASSTPGQTTAYNSHMAAPFPGADTQAKLKKLGMVELFNLSWCADIPRGVDLSHLKEWAKRWSGAYEIDNGTVLEMGW